MVVSSAVRSSRGRSSGTARPFERISCQYPVAMASSCQPFRRGANRGPVLARAPRRLNRLWPCRPSSSSSEHTPTSTTTTSPGCTCSWPTGRSSPTSRSPTWSCGCPTGTGADSGPVAQMRPTTGPTSLPDDVVGTFVPVGRRRDAGRGLRARAPRARGRPGVARRRAGPGRGDPRAPIGTGSSPWSARNTNLLGVRTPSRLELSYLQTAAELTQMIAGGWFPPSGQRSDHADSPAGRRRLPASRRRRQGRLRQPQRAVGLPAPGPPAATSPTSCSPT